MTEYAILEWLWDDHSIRVNYPNKEEKLFQGSYMELVEVLNQLGKEGWEVVTCTSGGDWILWTLKKVHAANLASMDK